MVVTKLCPKCKRILDVIMFAKDMTRVDCLQGLCKKCKKDYKIKNKKKIQEQGKLYYSENKEGILIRQKQSYDDGRNKYHKQYYEKNKKSILEDRKEYRINNSIKIKTYKQEYYFINKEIIDIKNKKYHKENPDVCRKAYQIRKSKKLSLPATLTVPQWNQIKKDFNYDCAYCGKELKLTQEHFIAVSKGGGYELGNILPICKSCNSSKQNSDFFEWYHRQKYYNKKRETFLLNYLGYPSN